MGSRCRRLPGRTLLLQTCLLLTAPLLGSQKGRDTGSFCSLNKTVGDSVQMPLNSSLHPGIREIEWTWEPEGDKKQWLVSWKPNTSNPEWYDLDKQYKPRFTLTKNASLSIKNVTMEMGGLYRATVKFRSGQSQEEVFSLRLYEPVPNPHIQIHSLSSTSGWCNISLECETPGTTENLEVTWHSGDLLTERQQRASLSLSLPWSQSDGHLTCVVSSPVDEKNATLHLGSICPQTDSPPSKWLWGGLLPAALGVGLLVIGLWIWMRKKRLSGKGLSTLLPSVTGPAAAHQALATEDSVALQAGAANSPAVIYAEIIPPPQQDTEKGSSHSHSPEYTPVLHTVYEHIRTRQDLQGVH